MQKINITLDVSKINKEKIVTKSYVNRNNEPVVVKEYKIEVVPVKEPKIIKRGDGWNLVKTHFVAEAQTKEERAAKKKSVFVGDGFQFQDSNVNYDEGEADPKDIPDPDEVTAF